MINTWIKRGVRSSMAMLIVVIMLCTTFCSAFAGTEDVATVTDLPIAHVASIYMGSAAKEYIGDVGVSVRETGTPYVSIRELESLFESMELSIDINQFDFAYGSTKNAATGTVLGRVHSTGQLTAVIMVGAPADQDLFIVMYPTERVESDPVQVPEEVIPEEEPTLVSSEEPVAEPTEEPAVEDTEEPTEEPVAEPTEEPAVEVTEEPAEEPVAEPTEEPAVEVTNEPAEEPVAEPTEEPAVEVTEESAEEPIAEPVEEPTVEPTAEPTEELDISPVVEPELSALIRVECKIAGEEKEYYLFGDEVGFEAVLIPLEEGFDPATLQLVYQWQLLTKENKWVDIEGANEQAYMFTLSEENYQNYYRVVVSKVQDDAAEEQEEV